MSIRKEDENIIKPPNTESGGEVMVRLVRQPAGFRGWRDANGLGCRTLWERHISGACILREVHDKGCSCSYCKSGEVGMILPEDKGRNSWRAIRWSWRGKLHVLRWTLPNWWPDAERKTMNNTTGVVEPAASRDLLVAEICPNHAAIAKAMKWRNEHTAHVERLESDATHCFVPCREDLHHPELWKAGSWKWLRQFFPANVPALAQTGRQETLTKEESTK